MIDILPNDFVNDLLYTKMEQLNSCLDKVLPMLDAINKDIGAVEKYLKQMTLLSKNVFYESLEVRIAWDADKKRLIGGVPDIISYTTNMVNLLECPAKIRLSAHKVLPDLLDLIISNQGVG